MGMDYTKRFVFREGKKGAASGFVCLVLGVGGDTRGCAPLFLQAYLPLLRCSAEEDSIVVF